MIFSLYVFALYYYLNWFVCIVCESVSEQHYRPVAGGSKDPPPFLIMPKWSKMVQFITLALGQGPQSTKNSSPLKKSWLWVCPPPTPQKKTNGQIQCDRKIIHTNHKRSQIWPIWHLTHKKIWLWACTMWLMHITDKISCMEEDKDAGK